MNWSKAKTILIVFFTIVNLFLLATIMSRNIKNYFIGKETIANTIEVLKSNGIKVNKDIIPDGDISVQQFEVHNIIDDYEGFARKLLGEECIKQSEGLYTSPKGRVEFWGDKFRYTTRYSGDTSINEDNMISVLNKFGINISDYRYSNGAFVKNINGLDVYDCSLKISFEEDDLLVISGVWFEGKEKAIQGESELKPITSVLIDILSSHQKPVEEVEVTNIKLGYMVYETEIYHKSVVLIPAWKMSFSNDEYVCLDARPE